MFTAGFDAEVVTIPDVFETAPVPETKFAIDVETEVIVLGSAVLVLCDFTFLFGVRGDLNCCDDSDSRLRVSGGVLVNSLRPTKPEVWLPPLMSEKRKVDCAGQADQETTSTRKIQKYRTNQNCQNAGII